MTDDDDIDQVLANAGERLRREAPHEVNARAAYARRATATVEDVGRRRSWWPAGIGIGLVAAALFGIFAYQVTDRPDGTILTPADTAVPDVTLPNPAHSDPSTSAAPSSVDSLPTTLDPNPVEPPVPDCGHLPLPQPPESFILIACVTSDDGSAAAIGARVPSGSSSIDDATSWFTTQSGASRSGSDLGDPQAVPGLDGVQAFSAMLTNGDACLVLVEDDTTSWKEICWSPQSPPTTGFTFLNDKFVQLDLTDAAAPTAVVLDERVWPSSGCTLDDAAAMARQVLDVGFERPVPGLVFTGLRCEGDRGSLSVGSVFLQPGPPDGLIGELQRVGGGGWDVVDLGTAGVTVDEFPPFGVPSYDVWSAWPGDTEPLPAGLDLGAANEPPTTDPAEFAARLVDIVDGATSQLPEFPAAAREVSVEPDGLPLVVIEADIGGDDSVGGQVYYVWLDESRNADGIVGWNVGTTYETQVCLRGRSTPDATLCI